MKHQSDPATHVPEKAPKHVRACVTVGLTCRSQGEIFQRDVSKAQVQITKRILSRVLDVSVSTISDDLPIDTLVTDSLIFEIMAMELEDFLGQEIDRLELLRAKTVTSLARLLRDKSIKRH